MIVVHALDSEGELRTDVANDPSALLTWQYSKDRGGGGGLPWYNERGSLQGMGGGFIYSCI